MGLGVEVGVGVGVGLGVGMGVGVAQFGWVQAYEASVAGRYRGDIGEI